MKFDSGDKRCKSDLKKLFKHVYLHLILLVLCLIKCNMITFKKVHFKYFLQSAKYHPAKFMEFNPVSRLFK